MFNDPSRTNRPNIRLITSDQNTLGISNPRMEIPTWTADAGNYQLW